MHLSFQHPGGIYGGEGKRKRFTVYFLEVIALTSMLRFYIRSPLRQQERDKFAIWMENK